MGVKVNECNKKYEKYYVDLISVVNLNNRKLIHFSCVKLVSFIWEHHSFQDLIKANWI